MGYWTIDYWERGPNRYHAYAWTLQQLFDTMQNLARHPELHVSLRYRESEGDADPEGASI